MIDRSALLADAKAVTGRLVDDLRERTEADEESRLTARETYNRARSAGRTDKSYEEWREDLLAQVAAGWVLASVFVRFCEDNGLVDTPLLSGPGRALELARDHRAEFFRANPAAGDREWLIQVYRRYQRIPAAAQIFGERNALWQLAPSADGARDLLETWWARDEEGRDIRHDFTDPDLDTRFLGDLYQDLSEHARKQYALLQTPDFIEEFILDRTLDPAIAEFGLAEVRMIDPTCGSGHFCLGAFQRLLARWQEREPGTGARELVQRALDAVHGVDVNPFAVEIARFRLLVAALRAAGERRLEDLPAFQLNLAVGDSLLHGTRPEAFFSGATEYGDTLRHHYPTEDAEAAERILTSDSYHAVVGNPPYITASDPALNAAYRRLYSTCHRKYSLALPMTERFLQLGLSGAGESGYVGLITANSFMQREMGRKLIEVLLPRIDLSKVIDTSGVHIPGHGTDTVIMFLRSREPLFSVVSVALKVEGESGRAEPKESSPWAEILEGVDNAHFVGRYIEVVDVPRERLAVHPWSLQGGAAPEIKDSLERAPRRVAQFFPDMGFTGITGEDDAFLLPADCPLGGARQTSLVRSIASGQDVRDWGTRSSTLAVMPHTASGVQSEGLVLEHFPHLWKLRSLLAARRTFSGETHRESGRPWWSWHQIVFHRTEVRPLLAFAEVATHNHFVVEDSRRIFDRTAPVMSAGADAPPEDLDSVASALNSSLVEFYVKQVCCNKDGSGEPWENRYQRASTRLAEVPLPGTLPDDLATEISACVRDLSALLPMKVAARKAPARSALDAAAERVTALRARMVALQEDLDWRFYRLYGLIDEDLTLDVDGVPALAKGERAFEIALARRMAAGEVTSSWFERHGSTPITDLPPHWSSEYRSVVQRRLDLIESDRRIRLLERPEYKRRWNWESLADLEREAQRTWLLDRIEALASAGAEDPVVTTCARLVDTLSRDDDAAEVVRDLGGSGVDVVALVTDLVTSAAVPYLAAWRLTDSGLRKRAAWERTWALQRIEDKLAARMELPEDDPQHLSKAEHAVARKEAGVEQIPVPPKYAKADFRTTTAWTLRGKLDVPKERFVVYPGTKAGADTSPVVGWAGWDHLQQARALAGHYSARKAGGAETDELVPLLAGVDELVPWLLQWHDEPDPTFGERMGQFFDGFVATEAAALGVTREDLAGWRPPAPARGRRRKVTT